MTIEQFNKLMEKAEKDLTMPDNMTRQQLHDLSVAVSSRYQRWLGIYANIFHEYETLSLEIEKMKGEEWKEIRFGDPKKCPAAAYGFKTRDEIESQYYQSKPLYDKMAEKNLLKVQVEYVEKTLDNIKTMGFQVKNLIDIQKLNLGGI